MLYQMEWTVPTRKIFDKEIGVAINSLISKKLSFLVIPYDDGLKKARSLICQKLLGPIFLESSNQMIDFPKFLGKWW